MTIARYVITSLATASIGLGAPASEPTGPAASDTPVESDRETADPRFGLLTPLPEDGSIPPIVRMLANDDAALAHRALQRGYARELKAIRRRYLRTDRPFEQQEEGVRQLREFTDPAAFRPMIEAMESAAEPFRLNMLNHFAEQGDAGQGALAWVAVHDRRRVMRDAAMSRMVQPASETVLGVVDSSLRSEQHAVVANAGALAGRLAILEAIPLLIAGQVAEGSPPRTGDLAWIAVSKQTVYVQRLEAVAGNGAAAFQPVTGVLTEGFILRVQDAVVHVYRAAVNHALVAMTSMDWGASTAHLGYDQAAWWDWYRDEYLPFKHRQAAIDAMAEGAEPRPAP